MTLLTISCTKSEFSREENKHTSPDPIHYTWDMNEDGLNDCEVDGSCDHMQDYSIPRYEIAGIKDGIVFDKRSGKWVDKFGICHTCTVGNGFKADGTMVIPQEKK